jgi:hypothetical protein
MAIYELLEKKRALFHTEWEEQVKLHSLETRAKLEKLAKIRHLRQLKQIIKKPKEKLPFIVLKKHSRTVKHHAEAIEPLMVEDSKPEQVPVFVRTDVRSGTSSKPFSSDDQSKLPTFHQLNIDHPSNLLDEESINKRNQLLV